MVKNEVTGATERDGIGARSTVTDWRWTLPIATAVEAVMVVMAARAPRAGLTALGTCVDAMLLALSHPLVTAVMRVLDPRRLPVDQAHDSFPDHQLKRCEMLRRVASSYLDQKPSEVEAREKAMLEALKAAEMEAKVKAEQEAQAAGGDDDDDEYEDDFENDYEDDFEEDFEDDFEEDSDEEDDDGEDDDAAPSERFTRKDTGRSITPASDLEDVRLCGASSV